jgi:hypothetical protein
MSIEPSLEGSCQHRGSSVRISEQALRAERLRTAERAPRTPLNRTNVPGFFIVGAPRCGTTALYTYLRNHPAVFMPDLKEPHLFSHDLPGSAQVRSREEYLALFAPAPEGAVIGEASVYYLLSRAAPRAIHEFNPDARIIIMLRDPVDLMYSVHTFNVIAGSEDVFDFHHALELEEARKQGRCLPSYHVDEPFKLYYRELARYSGHVERYLKEFGPDRVQVIIHEEFRKSPKDSFAAVCDFLGIERFLDIPFAVVNPNRNWRSRWLITFLRTSNGFSKKVARALLPLQLRSWLVDRLMRANLTVRPRPPLDPQLRAVLNEEFRPEVERLSKLLGRDLSCWCRSGS